MSASAQGNQELIRKIRKHIISNTNQLISFRDFMEMCLYDAEHGYYTRTADKIGKQGDFYTSANIGGLIGEMIARYAVQQIPVEIPLRLVEWGAGTGAIAVQALDWVQQAWPDRYVQLKYTIVEISPHHREAQREALRQHAKVVTILSPEEWRETDQYEPGTFVFSNELLDSFPVHRVRQKDSELFEIHVDWDDPKGSFVEVDVLCQNESIHTYIRESGVKLREGQVAEINLAAPLWVEARLRELKQGTLLTIDYGHEIAELFAEHRMNGTLMAYHRHQGHDDPYLHIGEQDLTSHVDFTACMRAGKIAGLASQKLITQREFLVEAGILQQFQQLISSDPFSAEAKRNRAIRQLLLSDQMSELFKVLIQTKR